jgi:hypothetical protein
VPAVGTTQSGPIRDFGVVNLPPACHWGSKIPVLFVDSLTQWESSISHYRSALAVTGLRASCSRPVQGVTMEKYIHDENLKLYRKVLSATTDDEKRKLLIDLIRDEVAKEAVSEKPR